MSDATSPAPRPLEPAPPRGSRDENPTDIGWFALVAEDLRTHGGRVSAPGFWAVAVHRFGNWRMGVRKPLRAPLTTLYRAAFQAVRLGFGIDLPYDTRLGRRVRIDHHGTVVIGARSIGNDVVIRHSAILGVTRRDAGGGKPVIEDGVELGPRACVIGAVTIGHHSLVCANTVVSISVPPRSTVLGVPGRLVDLQQHVGHGAGAVAETLK
jgi:serine O-acetyltransferase